MPTASYLKNNDYSIVNFKPYELDYNSILQEAAMKEQYWLQGVSKLQEGWKQINDLDPLGDENRNNLENFNKSAKEQILKLGKTDLSIQSNADQIKDIIKPLYDQSNPTSKKILLDSEINKFYKSQFQKVEGYKTKDKGIYYNRNNEQYLMDKYADYKDRVNGADDKELEGLYKTKTGYIPYYNYNKEISEIIKSCHPNKSTTSGLTENGMYFQTTVDNSLDAVKLRGCLSSGLSSEALTQMGIDGYVGYGKDYNSLGKAYILDLTNTKSALTKSRTDLYLEQEKYKVLLNKAATQEEKDIYTQRLSSLKQDMDYLDLEVGDIDKDINQINSNPDSIKDNYENLAKKIQINKIINSASSYNSYIDRQTTYKDNTFKLLEYKMNQEANMLNQREKFDYMMQKDQQQFEKDKSVLDAALSKYKGKGKNGSSTDSEGLDLIPQEQKNLGEGAIKLTPDENYQNFQNEKNAVAGRVLSKKMNTYNILRNTYITDLNSRKATPGELSSFQKTFPISYSDEAFDQLSTLVQTVGKTAPESTKVLNSFNSDVQYDKIELDSYINAEEEIINKYKNLPYSNKYLSGVLDPNGKPINFKVSLNDIMRSGKAHPYVPGEKINNPAQINNNYGENANKIGRVARPDNNNNYAYVYNGNLIYIPKTQFKEYFQRNIDKKNEYAKALEIVLPKSYELNVEEAKEINFIEARVIFPKLNSEGILKEQDIVITGKRADGFLFKINNGNHEISEANLGKTFFKTPTTDRDGIYLFKYPKMEDFGLGKEKDELLLTTVKKNIIRYQQYMPASKKIGIFDSYIVGGNTFAMIYDKTDNLNSWKIVSVPETNKEKVESLLNEGNYSLFPNSVNPDGAQIYPIFNSLKESSNGQ